MFGRRRDEDEGEGEDEDEGADEDEDEDAAVAASGGNDALDAAGTTAQCAPAKLVAGR